MSDITLGQTVIDTVTGFKGTVTSRVKYLNGCIQYCITPPVDKEGKLSKYEYIDESQLEIIAPKPSQKKQKRIRVPGGPQYNEPPK